MLKFNNYKIFFLISLLRQFYTYDFLYRTFYLNIDDSFNWKETMNNCINPMQNQGLCAASYAIAAASVLSDRFCIKSKGVNIQFSPQCNFTTKINLDIISCNTYADRCDGGNYIDAWKGINETGLISQECMPFLGDSKNSPRCPTPLTCILSRNSNLIYKISDFNVIKNNRYQAMLEIIKNGPVQAEMNLFEDFIQFHENEDGVYQYKYGSLISKINVKVNKIIN